MAPDTKDRVFLSAGTGLITVLTIYMLTLWFRYMINAIAIGIAIGATLVILILSLAVTSTGGSPGCLKAGRILLWLGMLGCMTALALGVLSAVGII